MISGKKGVELSVNFIVGLVLAIVVFLGGLYLLKSLSTTSDNFLNQKFDSFNSQMEDIACSGNEYVCVGITEKSARQGQTAVYTLVILNAYDTTYTFNVTVEPRAGPGGPDNLLKLNFFPRAPDNNYSINPDESKKIPIALHSKAGAALGTYSFRVNVTDESRNLYGASQILYLVVT
ncbi:hypothetical protein COT07_00235 [Candidatus Woesearchaeota archaeon CG07_land_8_20_14_0_80_44_23]|nr:MAG: hypothetical protein COT07_00235 [Candidatus Woesearchaeota archaeon CG07_land_8_20_14_0_80_44_23]